jgi:hypothetical protein
MAKYNWTLWNNFVQAAEELDIELVSTDGGCVYMEVPEDIRQKFYVMCWTPLNKLLHILRKSDRKNPMRHHDIKFLMDDFRQNHSDFHLEFGAKSCEHGSMFWFPNLAIGNTPSKDEIVSAVKIMLDRDNFDKYVTLALLREPSEIDYD